MCLFAVICLWGAHRAGLLQQGSNHSLPANRPSAAASPVVAESAPAATTPAVEPPKAADGFPLSASSLNDGDPSTFIALRYDKTRVLFRLGDEGDFGLEDPEQEKTFHPLPPQVAEYGGAPPFELEPAVFESVKQHYEVAHVGDQWQLEVSAGARVPVVIQKPIEMSWGCANNSFTAGFIAEVAPEFQAAFTASSQKYFLVHKSPPAAGSQPIMKPMRVAELTDWKPAPELLSQIEQTITTTIKDKIANDRGHRQDEVGGWKQFIAKTAEGDGKLTYEKQAFQLSPDGIPRVFVRAR